MGSLGRKKKREKGGVDIVTATIILYIAGLKRVLGLISYHCSRVSRCLIINFSFLIPCNMHTGYY